VRSLTHLHCLLASIDDQWQISGDFDYLITSQSMAWNSAQSFCSTLGGSFAVVESGDANGDVLSVVENTSVWIGLSFSNSQSAWYWVTGEELEYSNWSVLSFLRVRTHCEIIIQSPFSC
jgi:hypothetical protein